MNKSFAEYINKRLAPQFIRVFNELALTEARH
ncbi:MAG: hypothetical protein ACJATQ_001200 [Cellvibrionaceae bacterium]|jgi:hypothetical protein